MTQRLHRGRVVSTAPVLLVLRARGRDVPVGAQSKYAVLSSEGEEALGGAHLQAYEGLKESGSGGNLSRAVAGSANVVAEAVLVYCQPDRASPPVLCRR